MPAQFTLFLRWPILARPIRNIRPTWTLCNHKPPTITTHTRRIPQPTPHTPNQPSKRKRRRHHRRLNDRQRPNTKPPLVHSFTTPPRQPDIGPNACTQDKENWPRIATQQKQWTLADYSCNGATAAHAALYLQLAVRNKDLGPNTKKLIISLGALQPDQQFKAAIQTLNLPPDLYTSYLQIIKNWLPTVAPNLIAHPTHAGQQHMAQAIANHL